VTDQRDGNDGHEWGEAVVEGPGQYPHPGDIVVNPAGPLTPEPMVGRDQSTPLAEEEPDGLAGVVPDPVLWALKEHRHTQWHLLPAHERHDRLRQAVGQGWSTLYAVDDGRHHAALGRLVGTTPEGCAYVLVGRVDRAVVDDLAAGRAYPDRAFDHAQELALLGVAVAPEAQSSIVFTVARYDAAGDIPPEYRPGAEPIAFAEDLEIED
jgi:hypothetical protein